MSSPISNANMQAMITRMRVMAEQVSNTGVENGAATGATSFSDTLTQSLQRVNELQSTAEQKRVAFEMGEDVSIADVMLAKERASIAFEATLQVRNKVLSAYQEIMQMPV